MTEYVEVVVNHPPVRGSFHYHVPPDLEGHVEPGHLVTVPFGPRRVHGLVIRSVATPEVPETRPIEALVDPLPVLRPQQLDLASWIAEQTLSPLIDCLTLMLPPGLAQQADQRYTLVGIDADPRSPIEKRVLDLLRERGPLRGRQFAYHLPRQDWRRALESLSRRGAVAHEFDPRRPAPAPAPHPHRHAGRLAPGGCRTAGPLARIRRPPAGSARPALARADHAAGGLGLRRDARHGRRPALPGGA